MDRNTEQQKEYDPKIVRIAKELDGMHLYEWERVLKDVEGYIKYHTTIHLSTNIK